jgi:hypothetical protein
MMIADEMADCRQNDGLPIYDDHFHPGLAKMPASKGPAVPSPHDHHF